jgi:L-arabonate dehydrase
MKQRRSAAWFQGNEYYHWARRTQIRAMGISAEAFDGKPIIGIANTWSELNPCNSHLRELAEAVKRGVWAAGGVPLEFPVFSPGEMLMKPTAMLYRNLMSMDVEEMITANPLDAVVLLTGCDKTTPAALMGAASANVPAILMSGGPMLSAQWRGETLGSGTDGRRLFDEWRKGALSNEDHCELECSFARSHGHCMVMGTASTMALLAEALGMSLPGASAIPAADARLKAMAEATGARAVALAESDLSPLRIMTRAAFENALVALMAIGGSTNAVIHLLAMAGRCGVELAMDDFAAASQRTPVLANVKPSGQFLMEDFFYAGGLPALLRQLAERVDSSCLTVNGKTLGENIAAAPCWNEDVIRQPARALQPEGGIVVLRGNLAPNTALLKSSAASPALLRHSGPAFVFDNREQMLRDLEDESLPVEADSVLVLRNAGPLGGPGMPEWGHIPLPRKLLRQGVKDMLRLSDARMSGTSFGTVVLHVSPEAAAGGPLAAVRTGDRIALDADAKSIHVELHEEELARRMRQRTAATPHYQRGYGQLYLEQVEQAHLGCDFRFLKKR